MAENVFTIPPMLGGLVKSRPDWLLRPFESRNHSGVWVIDGIEQKRPGCRLFAEVPDEGEKRPTVNAIRQYPKNNGDTHVVVSTEKKFYEYTGSTLVDRTGETDFSTPAGGQVSTAVLEDLFLYTNYYDPPKKWDGVTETISDLGGAPKRAKVMTTFRNMLILGNLSDGVTAFPQTLAVSAIGNPEAWSPDDEIVLGMTPDHIVNISQMHGDLIVYKGNGISTMRYVGGSLIFEVDENRFYGCGLAAANSLARDGSYHYFLGRETGKTGFYAFDGVNPPRCISDPIFSVLNNLTPNARMGTYGFYWGYYGLVVWLVAMAPSTQPNVMLAYRPETQDAPAAWYYVPIDATMFFPYWETADAQWNELRATSWADWDWAAWDTALASGNAPLILKAASDGNIYQVEGTDDNGVDYEAFVDRGFFHFNDQDPRSLDYLYRIEFETTRRGEGEILDIELFTDNDPDTPVVLNDAGDKKVSITLDGTGSVVRNAADVSVAGNSFMLRYGSSNPFAVHRIRLFWDTIGMT
ncbi:MAG: hypothetical protein V2A77_04535 [Pseudomonadota bacterium]